MKGEAGILKRGEEMGSNSTVESLTKNYPTRLVCYIRHKPKLYAL